ncbi:MAG TPA: hypothetical protein VE176_06495, partial [Candidatus Limnocylindrales bacterium]|nr:hypothetical protein [Candidatus Limnocylindrales bacterium]
HCGFGLRIWAAAAGAAVSLGDAINQDGVNDFNHKGHEGAQRAPKKFTAEDAKSAEKFGKVLSANQDNALR